MVKGVSLRCCSTETASQSADRSELEDHFATNPYAEQQTFRGHVECPGAAYSPHSAVALQVLDSYLRTYLIRDMPSLSSDCSYLVHKTQDQTHSSLGLCQFLLYWHSTEEKVPTVYGAASDFTRFCGRTSTILLGLNTLNVFEQN